MTIATINGNPSATAFVQRMLFYMNRSFSYLFIHDPWDYLITSIDPNYKYKFLCSTLHLPSSQKSRPGITLAFQNRALPYSYSM